MGLIRAPRYLRTLPSYEAGRARGKEVLAGRVFWYSGFDGRRLILRQDEAGELERGNDRSGHILALDAKVESAGGVDRGAVEYGGDTGRERGRRRKAWRGGERGKERKNSVSKMPIRRQPAEAGVVSASSWEANTSNST